LGQLDKRNYFRKMNFNEFKFQYNKFSSSLWRHWKRHRVPSRENGWNPKNSQKPPNNSSSKQLRLNFPNEHESHLQTQTSSPTLSHHSSPGSDDQCEFKNNTVVRMVVEFIIENAILPTSSIIQSLSFKCLISMANGPVSLFNE
jgi:hypothetical protein